MSMDTNNVTKITTNKTSTGTGRNVLDRAEAFLAEAFSVTVVDRCTGSCPVCDTNGVAHAA
jgi:spore coat polysaccharide biosynthesis protein SpsF (cytidylyltransferase family)